MRRIRRRRTQSVIHARDKREGRGKGMQPDPAPSCAQSHDARPFHAPPRAFTTKRPPFLKALSLSLFSRTRPPRALPPRQLDATINPRLDRKDRPSWKIQASVFFKCTACKTPPLHVSSPEGASCDTSPRYPPPSIYSSSTITDASWLALHKHAFYFLRAYVGLRGIKGMPAVPS
jgi:hypothetical protein